VLQTGFFCNEWEAGGRSYVRKAALESDQAIKDNLPATPSSTFSYGEACGKRNKYVRHHCKRPSHRASRTDWTPRPSRDQPQDGLGHRLLVEGPRCHRRTASRGYPPSRHTRRQSLCSPSHSQAQVGASTQGRSPLPAWRGGWIGIRRIVVERDINVSVWSSIRTADEGRLIGSMNAITSSGRNKWMCRQLEESLFDQFSVTGPTCGDLPRRCFTEPGPRYHKVSALVAMMKVCS
jgi:hypothetical protein